jgi:hypothetical protein
VELKNLSFTHRISGNFYIADFKPLRNQELSHCAVMNPRIQVQVKSSKSPDAIKYQDSGSADTGLPAGKALSVDTKPDEVDSSRHWLCGEGLHCNPNRTMLRN